MTDLASSFRHYLPPPLRYLPWRAHPLDGKLLLFERSTGLNVLLEGDETRYLRRTAPRALLVAVTNACNLTCDFCYRDLQSRSRWRYDTLIAFCQEADLWGVLEVAFGGGEPMLFPRWQDFICQLYDTTNLCINFTTNGTLLTESFLHAVAGRYGEIRVSLYEDNNWPATIRRLTDCGARFGVNWLITHDELKTIGRKFSQLLALDVRDFLLLSYKGCPGSKLHLSGTDYQHLASFINQQYAQHGREIQIKLDVCWGDVLPQVPRLFATADCEAGDDFLSITSDLRVKPCSFHHTALPFETMRDVQAYWHRWRKVLQAAPVGGCARLPHRGLAEGGLQHALIDLATIQ
jgi:MoaA/NifB/PqqE/SkfB family radical SAM enzyme